ncbi:hypothetical protein F4804DRAFT_349888 [Jackrogersella minutella]|nr:hypothetical protein F4804DRAFT_349888 [Jackrogersella minutella]
MCNWLTLEICCTGESAHALPFTLKICLVMVLCDEVILTRELDQETSDTPIRPPLAYGHGCPNFNPTYTRCERIFWTCCDSCCRAMAAKTENFNEHDLLVALEYNRLLRRDLAKQLCQRPYDELVRAFPTEFDIKRRYMLSGSRWIEVPEPTDTDALGPNPPFDHKLEGLEWWLEQGMGLVGDEVWNTICSYYNPSDPFRQTIANWIEWLPSTPDQFSTFDTRSVSTISAATSFEDRISLSSPVVYRGYKSYDHWLSKQDWYPSTSSSEATVTRRGYTEDEDRRSLSSEYSSPF